MSQKYQRIVNELIELELAQKGRDYTFSQEELSSLLQRARDLVTIKPERTLTKNRVVAILGGTLKSHENKREAALNVFASMKLIERERK